MKIDQVRSNADYATGKVSDLSRQFNLAGIAIIWIFLVGTDSGGLAYNGEIIYPLACFVIALVVELSQYIYSAIAWKRAGDAMDKNNQSQHDIGKSINTIAYVLFWTKVVLVLVGYFFIFINIGSEILS